MTSTMRGKEDAHDYRYFPDPDLLPLTFDDAFIDKIKKDNDVWISTGAVLFLPLLAGMKSNKKEAELLAAIKGNLVAVKQAAMKKDCKGAGYIPQ